MSLDLDQVRRIADLARIEITDEEAHHTLAQLVDIFGMIERMQAVDTDRNRADGRPAWRYAATAG